MKLAFWRSIEGCSWLPLVLYFWSLPVTRFFPSLLISRGLTTQLFPLSLMVLGLLIACIASHNWSHCSSISILGKAHGARKKNMESVLTSLMYPGKEQLWAQLPFHLKKWSKALSWLSKSGSRQVIIIINIYSSMKQHTSAVGFRRKNMALESC